MSAKWSGYATQSEAWQRGYDWARNEGPYGNLDCFEASERFGYTFGEKDDEEFAKGADFAQLLQAETRQNEQS